MDYKEYILKILEKGEKSSKDLYKEVIKEFPSLNYNRVVKILSGLRKDRLIEFRFITVKGLQKNIYFLRK